MLREQDKHFLWSLYTAFAVVFTWKGLWDGLYEVPYIGDPFIFLFIGFAMLSLTGLIFNEFDPLGGLEKNVNKIVRKIETHPQKSKFKITYYDKHLKKEIAIPATQIIKLESDMLVVKHGQRGQEVFIPIHRLRQIFFQGQRYWRL